MLTDEKLALITKDDSKQRCTRVIVTKDQNAVTEAFLD
jgi:hypothetical protein